MSTFKVTIESIEILSHPNADALELAKVGEYRAVVPKGVYKTDQFVLYIPEQAVLPPELIAELGLEGKLAGSEHNRVKAVKLRGELSQGIVCRPSKLADIFEDLDSEDLTPDYFAKVAYGVDFAKAMSLCPPPFGPFNIIQKDTPQLQDGKNSPLETVRIN